MKGLSNIRYNIGIVCDKKNPSWIKHFLPLRKREELGGRQFVGFVYLKLDTLFLSLSFFFCTNKHPNVSAEAAIEQQQHWFALVLFQSRRIL